MQLKEPILLFKKCAMIGIISGFFLTPSVYAATKTDKPTLAALYDELIPSLRKGQEHLFIYVVPPETIESRDRTIPEWWKNCVLGGMLTEEGRLRAQRLGDAIRKLDIPIGMVRTSEVCVTLDVAKQMVGNVTFPLYPTPDLNPAEIQKIQFNHSDDVARAHQWSVFLIGSVKETNTIVVGQKEKPEVAVHPILSQLEPGETAIFAPSPKEGLVLKARLTVGQWQEMARYATRKSPKKPIKR
jgi:hypothetical protein